MEKFEVTISLTEQEVKSFLCNSDKDICSCNICKGSKKTINHLKTSFHVKTLKKIKAAAREKFTNKFQERNE